MRVLGTVDKILEMRRANQDICRVDISELVLFIAYNTIEAKIRNKYYKKTYPEPKWHICMCHLGPKSVPDVVVTLCGVSDIGCYINIVSKERKKINI